MGSTDTTVTQPKTYATWGDKCGHVITVDEQTYDTRVEQRLPTNSIEIDGTLHKFVYIPSTTCPGCRAEMRVVWERWSRKEVDEMLQDSGGRTLDQLFELIGRQVEVQFFDYGCSGSRISWSETFVITAFLGPGIHEHEAGDWDNPFMKNVIGPKFQLSNGSRWYLCNMQILQADTEQNG